MKITAPAALHMAPQEIQAWYDGQFTNWMKFFKRASRNVLGTKRRLKIQSLARQEITRTIAEFGERPPERQPACRAGCPHCCYFSVNINVLEAARLAELVQNMPEERRAATVQRLHMAAAAWEQSANRNHPCPFIVDDMCSVYEDRPLACRSYVSVDAGLCLTERTTTKAVLRSGDPGYNGEAIWHNTMWLILSGSISRAANQLIGSAGELSAEVLKQLAKNLQTERPPCSPAGPCC
jgi:Fe-S-cluster containining protein